MEHLNSDTIKLNFIQACNNGNVDTVNKMLDQGSLDGQTMSIALKIVEDKENNEEIVKLINDYVRNKLKTSFIDIEVVQLIFFQICRLGGVDNLIHMIKEYNIDDDGVFFSGASEAVRCGNLEVVKYLIMNKHVKFYNHNACLFSIATKYNQQHVLEYLNGLEAKLIVVALRAQGKTDSDIFQLLSHRYGCELIQTIL